MSDATVRVLFLGNASSALRSTRILESSFRGIGRTARIAGVAIGTAVVGGMTLATKAAIDFDKAMRSVNSIAKLSEPAFDRLQKKVLGLAGKTGKAPKDLADGLYDVVSSGFDADDALVVLEASARAATAGITTTAVATKAVSAALNAYHLPASKAREVSDVLFTTVDKGVLTFEELAQNMGDLVPASAPLGVSLEEVGAALATITLQGVPAAEAATRVKNTMLRLANPSKELTKFLEDQGFASGSAAIEALGYEGVLGLLNKATKGNVEELGKLFPEQRAQLGMVGLLGKNTKTYKRILEEMEGATEGAGRTSEVFAEQGKSISVQWDKAKARLSAAGISLAQQWFPAIEGAIDKAATFAGWLERLGKQKTIDAKVRFAVAGLGSLREDLSDLLFGKEGKTVPVRIEGGKIAWKLVGYKQGLLDQVGDQLESAFSEQAMFGTAGKRVRVPIEGGRFEWKIEGAKEGWLNALERELEGSVEAIDFSRVGRILATTGSGLIQVAGVLAVSLAKLIAKAIEDIDWTTVGKGIAEGLAAAGEDALKELAPDRLAAAMEARKGGASDQDQFIAFLGLDPGKDYSADVAKWFGSQIKPPEGFGKGFGEIFGAEDAEAATKRVSGAASTMFGIILQKIAPVIGQTDALDRALRNLPGRHKFTAEHNIPESISQVEAYRNAIFSIPSSRTTTVRVVKTGPGPSEFAGGGMVSGPAGAPQLVLAHGGEMFLNRSQQQALGGPTRLASMFGFPSFARGGIIGGRARGVGEIEEQYGLMQRLFSLPRSEDAEEFGPHEVRRLVGNRQRLIRAWRRRRVRIRRRLRNKDLEGFERRSLRRELGDIPFDIASARLDIRELRQADVGEREGPDVDRLLAQIGQLKLALGIQGAQMSVLGSFKNGIRFVPRDGLAALHKGEQVIPAGKVRGGDGAFTPTIVVENHFAPGMEWLERFVDTRVRTSANADALSSRIGSRASERNRSRRF